jgi:DNA-binding NarL/FixJ family response regulator
MLPHEPLHILIVDPDISAANVTGAIAARAAPGAVLTIAPEAAVAGRNLARLQPDVLIIDPSPSPEAGSAVIAAVKRPLPGARVIVLASAPTAGLRRRMRDLGVDLYLEKPAPLLVEELRRLLAAARGS